MRDAGLAVGLKPGLTRGSGPGLKPGPRAGLRRGLTQGPTRGLTRGQNRSLTAGLTSRLVRGLPAGLKRGLGAGLRPGPKRGARLRQALIAGLCLGLWTTLASALEVEDRRVYPGTTGRVLSIVSTADLEVFEPYILRFQERRPDLTVDYTVASSVALYRGIRDGAEFDLAISSAMDLQLKLANDGLAQSHRSDRTDALPDWARWRDLIFAFTAEPAVVVLSSRALDGAPPPATRQELITLLRDNPERFRNAIGTYDVRDSGLGFLFATQEARSTDAYWRLSEVMGRLAPELYCCSGQMVDDVISGRLSLAYNVLGSYAADRMAQEGRADIEIVQMQDFANLMLRTAIIPATARETGAAREMLDMLLDLGLRAADGAWPLPPLSQGTAGFGPIRLGPALMVYLDPLNRRAFLSEWENALEQAPAQAP